MDRHTAPRCPVCSQPMRPYGRGATRRKHPDQWYCPGQRREWDESYAAGIARGKPWTWESTPHDGFPSVYHGSDVRSQGEATRQIERDALHRALPYAIQSLTAVLRQRVEEGEGTR